MLERVPGRASGVGSWPGTDAVESARIVFGELRQPHLPYLPELPARGPGAELVGRGAALLVDLPVDLQPSGWRFVDRPGRDLARAAAFLQQDLDTFAEVAEGFRGSLKVQVAGPWTLAAWVRLARLERAVVDPGACRDLVASLAEGVAQHVGRVRTMLPGVEVVVQVDEPSLPDVMQGRLRTASGFGRLRPVEEPVVVDGLRAVLEAAREAGAVGTVVHCCAVDAPVATLTRAGASGVGLDVSCLDVAGWEEVAAAVEGGTTLWAGVAAASGAVPSACAVAERVVVPWQRVGLPLDGLGKVVLTPACGLAEATPTGARGVQERVRDGAGELGRRAVAG
jgi:methionine synthase II (cobalamin-independent)